MYPVAKAMLIAQQVEQIDKYKFAKAALDKVSKTFMVHVAAMEMLFEITIHLFQTAPVPQKAA